MDNTNAVILSDEDFLKQLEAEESNSSAGAIEDTPSDVSEVTKEDTQETAQTNTEDITENTKEVTTEDTQEQSQELTNNEDNVQTDGNEETESTENIEVTDDKATEPTNEVDYKAFYEAVTQDYKANGKVLPGVKDPSKFIQALQMATDYAHKTSAIKPIMKRAKLLEDITDEQLSEMLEFNSRNPEVIKKALKDANIDPVELDLTEINYQPHSKVMSDADYAYQETVNELYEEDPVIYDQVRTSIKNDLDHASRDLILEDANALRAIQIEMKLGRFNDVMAQVRQQKVFNPALRNTPDLYVYRDIIMAQEQAQTNVTTPVVSQQPSMTKPVSKVSEAELEDKRNKAQINEKRKVPATPTKHNPLKLSDEEFMKLLDQGAQFIS